MTELSRPAPPVLRKEVVETAALGEVVVRALKLSERMTLGRPADSGGGVASADLFTARLLAIAVTDKAGVALYTVEEWDIFGAQNLDDTNRLIDVAMRLGGFGGDAKNG